MGRNYAALQSAHGQQRMAVVRRRRDYLQTLLSTGQSDLDRDRAELSALTWTLDKVEELRERMDAIAKLVAEDGAVPELAARVRVLLTEEPETDPRRDLRT